MAMVLRDENLGWTQEQSLNLVAILSKFLWGQFAGRRGAFERKRYRAPRAFVSELGRIEIVGLASRKPASKRDTA
jgi:hypothetical protein